MYSCRKRLSFWFIVTVGVAVIVCQLFADQLQSQARYNKPRVLIVNSYNKGLKWSDGIMEGIESVLSAEFDISVEYMDCKRYLSDTYFKALYDLYELKYNDVDLDIIISTDDNAYQFLLENHQSLFPAVPVVFCGVNNFDPGQIAEKPLFTGVLEQLHLDRNIDLVMRLHPAVENIIVISDDTTNGIANSRRIREISKSLPRVNWLFYDSKMELDEKQLVSLVSKAPQNTVVYYTDYFRDPDGNLVDYEKLMQKLSQVAPGPIYTQSDIYLGYGVAGGYMVSGFYQGKVAGEIAKKILTGTPVEKVPIVEEGANKYMFDYQQLQRWKISENILPPGSIMINRPQSFYYQYKVMIWSISGAFAFLAIVILALFSALLYRRKIETKLRIREKRYSFALQAARSGSWEWDIITNDLFWSEHVEPLFGFEKGRFSGTLEAFMDCILEQDRQKVSQAIEKALQGRSDYYIEHRIVWPDKTIHWVSETGTVEYDKTGRPVRMFGIVQDITQRRHYEDEREKLLHRLKIKNEELQSVVYTASHDLKSPLVNVQGFTGELIRDCESLIKYCESQSITPSVWQEIRTMIKENIPVYIRYIKTSVDKMSMLLDGLLKVSRIGTQQLNFENLDMNELLENIKREMSYQVTKLNGTIDVERLPPCMGDARQINQLFTNLIDNALKYRSPDRPPAIQISGKYENGFCVYSVRDNGRGILPEHTKHIFEIFYRLDPSSPVKGEGLGLTIVQRIVDRHDGRVWIEPVEGHGACFCVAIKSTLMLK